MSEMAMGFNEVTPDKPDWGSPESSSNDRVYYPEFTLKAEDIPEAESWEVGEDYTIEVQVRMVSDSKQSEKNGKDIHDYRFEVRGVKAGAEVDKKEKTETE